MWARWRVVADGALRRGGGVGGLVPAVRALAAAAAPALHPISQVVLDGLRHNGVGVDERVQVAADGTFTLEVVSEAGHPTTIATRYDSDSNAHVLEVVSPTQPELNGEVQLMCSSGQAWGKAAFDIDKIVAAANELAVRCNTPAG